MPSTLSRYEFLWAADSSFGDITGAVNLNKMSAVVLRQRSRSRPFLPVLNCPAQCFPQSSEKPEKYQRILSLSSACTVFRDTPLCLIWIFHLYLYLSLSSVSDSVHLRRILKPQGFPEPVYIYIFNTSCYILIPVLHIFYAFVSSFFFFLSASCPSCHSRLLGARSEPPPKLVLCDLVIHHLCCGGWELSVFHSFPPFSFTPSLCLFFF